MRADSAIAGVEVLSACEVLAAFENFGGAFGTQLALFSSPVASCVFVDPLQFALFSGLGAGGGLWKWPVFGILAFGFA